MKKKFLIFKRADGQTMANLLGILNASLSKHQFTIGIFSSTYFVI
jgi:hypothetical protein